MKKGWIKPFTVVLLLSLFVFITGENSEAKKKPSKPQFVGALKCDGSCHDPMYLAWAETPHAKTYKLLKPGERDKAKKKAEASIKEKLVKYGGRDKAYVDSLDVVNHDFTKEPFCIMCHTTGYKQAGGFKGPDDKKPTPKEDRDEPNLAAVGCEVCHTVNGGAMIRVIMKEKKEKYTRTEVEAVGQRYDYENVCKRCHAHPNTPFPPSLNPKYRFNYEARKKNVHNYEEFINDDNRDQQIEKDDEGKSLHGVGDTEKNPLPIEQWKIVDGKLKTQVWPAWDKEKKQIAWK